MIKDRIETLGIPKSHKCPNCRKTTTLSYDERNNLAECILANGAGLWALLHCDYCGWVDEFYPTAINGVPATKEECEALFAEMKKYDRQED